MNNDLVGEVPYGHKQQIQHQAAAVGLPLQAPSAGVAAPFGRLPANDTAGPTPARPPFNIFQNRTPGEPISQTYIPDLTTQLRSTGNPVATDIADMMDALS